MQPVSLDYRHRRESDADYDARGKCNPKFYDHGKAFRLYDSHILNITGIYEKHRGIC